MRCADNTRGQGCPAFAITRAATVAGGPLGAARKLICALATVEISGSTVVPRTLAAADKRMSDSVPLVATAGDAIPPTTRSDADVAARARTRSATIVVAWRTACVALSPGRTVLRAGPERGSAARPADALSVRVSTTAFGTCLTQACPVGVRGALLAEITRCYPAAARRMADQRPIIPAPFYGHVGTGRNSRNNMRSGLRLDPAVHVARHRRGARGSGNQAGNDHQASHNTAHPPPLCLSSIRLARVSRERGSRVDS